jgi:cytochrome c-type biogenesis protein CcmH
MIWILFAVITAGVVLAIARPLGRPAEAASAGVSEIEAYKLQLAELAQDEELGGIGKDEAAQTRAEISRRLLKASREAASSAFSGKPAAFNTNYVFAALATFIAVGSAGLYALYGAYGMPDQPLEARLSAPPSEQPPVIQIANIERRLRKEPDDVTGWTLIAPLYFRTGQFDNATQAYRQAIKLSGADEDKLLGLFEAMTYAAEGNVPAEARQILEKALVKNPDSLRGRIWLAISKSQEGKKGDAERIYREILSGNPPAEWRGIIFRQLALLKDAPKQETAQAGDAPAAGGQQLPSVDVMVERLSARLKKNPADLNGWLMMIRSYSALKAPEKEQEAIASARKQFASAPEALSQIDALLKELAAAGTAAPAAGEVKAPAEAAAGDQSELIRGMVGKLAARLKENAADADGWLMLIRSYGVLKETDKAKEAVASARKQFASDSGVLGKIETLAHELGLEAAGGKGEQAKP